MLFRSCQQKVQKNKQYEFLRNQKDSRQAPKNADLRTWEKYLESYEQYEKAVNALPDQEIDDFKGLNECGKEITVEAIGGKVRADNPPKPHSMIKGDNSAEFEQYRKEKAAFEKKIMKRK
jgi:hypothetical protein